MGKLINDLWKSESVFLYPKNTILNFFSYMPMIDQTDIIDDEVWMTAFVENECLGNVQLVEFAGSDAPDPASLCAEYPEDLTLFVMRAEIRKQRYG